MRMASRMEDIFAAHVDPMMTDLFGETITRRIRGSTANTEQIVGAVVERDLSAAGAVSDSGFVVSDKGQESVRLARVDIPANYDVNEHDRYVINGEVWDVVGLPVGDDSSRKTVLCRLNHPQTGRRPRTER